MSASEAVIRYAIYTRQSAEPRDGLSSCEAQFQTSSCSNIQPKAKSRRYRGLNSREQPNYWPNSAGSVVSIRGESHGRYSSRPITRSRRCDRAAVSVAAQLV